MLPWNAEELTFDEARFTGAVRLFPLPDLVMFPHVVQPLHVFEPRYRDLLNAALDGDGLIAMSVLAPGWESEYYGRPALMSQICLGKVITHHRLPDGCYNLMLLGLKRGRIVHEAPAQKSYREAEVVLFDDQYPEEGTDRRSAVQRLLIKKFKAVMPAPQDAKQGALRELLAAKLPLGPLTDLMSFALPLPPTLKSELLAEANVDRRAALLLQGLGVAADVGGRSGRPSRRQGDGRLSFRWGFPPSFSDN